MALPVKKELLLFYLLSLGENVKGIEKRIERRENQMNVLRKYTKQKKQKQKQKKRKGANYR